MFNPQLNYELSWCPGLTQPTGALSPSCLIERAWSSYCVGAPQPTWMEEMAVTLCLLSQWDNTGTDPADRAAQLIEVQAGGGRALLQVRGHVVQVGGIGRAHV